LSRSDRPLDGPNPGHEIYFAEVVPHRTNKGEFELKPESETDELPFYMEEVKDADGKVSRKPKKFYTDDYRAVKVYLETLKFSGVTITCSRIISPCLLRKPLRLIVFRHLTVLCITKTYGDNWHYCMNGVAFTPMEYDDDDLITDEPVTIGISRQ
jgi:hypothetical protein